MRDLLSKFIAFHGASLARADFQFIDFWQEADSFATEIFTSLNLDNKKVASSFYNRYQRAKQATRFYQDSGPCDSGFTNPSYEPVDVVSFDDRAAMSTNLENFADMLGDWIESYACLESHERVAGKQIRVPERSETEYAYHISPTTMDYDEAMAYCYLRGSWLAQPDGDKNRFGAMTSALSESQWYWFNGDADCQVVRGGQMIYNTQPTVDCTNQYHAVCETGQFTDMCFPGGYRTCHAWGDPHFTTFDGEYHHFQGSCGYTMVEVNNLRYPNVPWFKIKSDLDYNKVHSPYTFIRDFTFEFMGQDQVRGEVPRYVAFVDAWRQVFRTAFVEDRHLGITYTSDFFGNSDFTFDVNPTMIRITTWFDVYVTYVVGDSKIWITVPDCYADSVEGLCGNYNGDTYDEFDEHDFGEHLSNWKKIQEELTEWAAPFEDGSDRCRQIHDLECSLHGESGVSYAIDQCLPLDPNNADTIFENCNVVRDPYNLACVTDICEGEERCDMFKAFATQCINDLAPEDRAPVCEWANALGCAESCGANARYEGCANVCDAERTCSNRAQPCPIGAEVDSMCVCEPGYILEDGICILESDCGCSEGGHYYRLGEEFSTTEDNCECTHDGIVCLPIPCEDREKGTCYVHSDPYIVTFDHTKYGFHGNCRYSLVNIDDTPELAGFDIDISNRRREDWGFGSGSVLDRVWFKFHSRDYSFGDEKRYLLYVKNKDNSNYFSQTDLDIYVYDRETGTYYNRDFTNDDVELKIVSEGYYWQRYYQIKIWNGIELKYKHSYWWLEVDVPECFRNAVSGLCGNWDGVTDTQMNVDYQNDPDEFGNRFLTWRNPSFCTHGQYFLPCQQIRELPEGETLYREALDRCSSLKDRTSQAYVFDSCTFVYDKQGYYDMCLFNSCIQDDLACGPIDNFARSCLWNKIPGGPDYKRICTWPQVTGCTEECSGGQVYKGCTNNCLEQRTCDDVANGVSNADRCGTGRAIYAMCGCPDGQVMHNGECINEAACPRDCDETDTAFCEALGDPHYKTFDGEYHHFQGLCKYTFVESAGDDEFRKVPAFKIDVDQGSCGDIFSNAVTCIRGMTFEFPGKEQGQNETPRYLFTGHGEKEVFTFEDRKTGEIYNNNLYNGDVDFELIGNEYNIETWFGAKVQFRSRKIEKLGYIKVTLPKCYMNNVIGLCGNWNNVTYDQFVKLSDNPFDNWRGHQEGLQAWANDFGEPDPHCREVHDFECDDIDAVSDLCLALDPNNVDRHSYFFDCSPYVEKTAAHIACLIDGCTDRSSLCGSLGSYAKECLNSIPISLRPNVCSWATESGCEQECGANSVFEGCANTCQAKKTCRNRHMSNSERCGADINEIDSMCVCEPGYVLDNGNCIREEDCGCVWEFNGIYFSQGTSFANEDETCECTAEGVVCTPIPCETTGYAYCQSHYAHYVSTFDGYRYDFHGNCRYNLASAPDREDVSGFDLDSKNRKPYLPFRGTVTDELWFDFHGSNYVFGDEKRFSFHVRNLDDSEYYNNARFEVTFVDNQTGEIIFDAVSTISSNINLSTEDYRVSLLQSDGDIVYVRVITSNNVNFYFSRYYWSATLWVNRCYKNVMTGLCGNYNNNDSEERILAIEYADESEDFGDRFQTDDDDTCAHGERLRPCEDLSSAAYDAAADRCDIVDQNPRISENQNFFRGCEFLGNRSPFYEACLFNSCLERDLHCGIIGDYASQCLSRKVPGSADYERICDWASKTGCEEECPANQGSTTLIGSTPIAPAIDTLIGEITSSAYSSFEVSIFCASDSLPFGGYKSILHVSSGTNYGEVGSRVFTFWRHISSNAIYIATPIGTGGLFKLHTCEANTYSTYKMVVSPDENDSSQSVVELFIDGESVATRTADKTQLIGDGVELQVWAGNEWRGSYGTGTTYLIKDLIYNGNIRQVNFYVLNLITKQFKVFKGCTTACFEQQTCEDVARGLSKEDRCADSGELVEGMCGCPDGHVLDEGVCVSESSCGCINEAAEYAAVGSKQIVGPEECTCTEGGEYECVALGCPCDKFDEECIDFVCEAPRNFDAAEEGYVGKFIPPQEFEISFEWLCEESLTTTKYVQGPHIIDIETPRSVLSENPSDMLPGIEDEGKQKKKTNRNGSARSGRISPYWFAYIANQSGSAVLVHTNGGSSWVTHWLGAGRGPQCIPGFNEMKLTQVFDSETNTYIMKTFLNNIEIGNLDIPFDQYFQVESELAVYIGSPWSHRLYAGMLGQIRNFYMRDLSKQCFIGETPEISGGRVALKDIDLEKSFRVSMELDCNETISLSTYGTVWDIRDKDIPRSEGPSSNPAILDDEESRFTSPYDGKAYTLINRYPSSTFIILFDGPGATHTDHGNFDMRYSPLTYNWGVQVMRYWLNDCPGDGWTRFEFEHKFDVDTGLWTDMWTIDGVPAVSSSYSPESWTQGNNFKLGLSNGPETEAEVNVRNFCYQGLNYV
uniref:Oikosin 30c n=1 Tax=Oikopleura dioica TaxID=34765 RepID=W8W0Z5_OIKDI|nr:oikosin 30c [Oikopleura dioica]